MMPETILRLNMMFNKGWVLVNLMFQKIQLMPMSVIMQGTFNFMYHWTT